MEASKTVAVNSQVLRTSKITLRYLAGCLLNFLSNSPPRLLSSSSISTREIDVSADSVAAKKPAKPKSKTMATIAYGLIAFLPIR